LRDPNGCKTERNKKIETVENGLDLLNPIDWWRFLDAFRNFQLGRGLSELKPERKLISTERLYNPQV
jgi:hypothetical protein